MPKPPLPTRFLLALGALGAITLPVAGCGTGSADTERGRTLFVQKCGTCHAMAQAGTTGQQGPDLDAAFAAARASGQTDSTIEGVVTAQVENPRPLNENTAVSMPAEIVTGKDLEDVAAYVGEYAGVPGAAPPKVPGGPGAQIFTNNGCGGCHTLAAANAGGTVGPDLDLAQGLPPAIILKSIVDPNATIATGYPPNVMPDNYETLLSPMELQQLADFISNPSAKGASGK